MDSQLLKSYELHQSGKLAEAQAGYIQILKSDSKNFNALQLLGALYLQKQNFLEALKALKSALEINQSHALPFHNYAIALENLGDLTGALNAYEKVLTINPNYIQADENRVALIQKINHANAFEEAKSQLRTIKESVLYTSPPPKGYKRGIDYYGDAELLLTITTVMLLFKGYFKFFPNLIDPEGLNEKIQWMKFFYPIKFPESGDKLQTHTFVPNEIRKELTCPKVVWHSRFPKLPSNKLIKTGWYYLKSNYGSGMFKRIHYPLSTQDVIELEKLCTQWLAGSYGLNNGEWWYNCFTKNILLEEEVKDLNGPISYNFHVANGRLLYINYFQKPELGSEGKPQDTRFDSDFNELSDQHNGCSRISIKNLRSETQQKMKFFAEKIGVHFAYVRVDFFLDQNQKIYLGEVTLSPTNGFESRPSEFEKFLGQQINLSSREMKGHLNA